MKTNCKPIKWTKYNNVIHDQIIKCFDDNQDSVKKLSAKVPGSESIVHVNYDPLNYQGFSHLYEWKNKETFFAGLLKDYSIDFNLLSKLSIQQSCGPVSAHTDVDRKVIAFYLVAGVAETVFYSSDTETISGTSFKDKMHELTEIERVKMKPGSWYLFNTAQIHSVDCPTDVRRTSLALDLTEIFNDYKNAIKKIAHTKVLFL